MPSLYQKILSHCLLAMALLATAIIAPLAAAEASQVPQPFTATYEASYNGLNVTAVRSLTKLDNGEYKLSFDAKSFFATIEEFSQFRWQGHQMVPSRYEYHRTGLSKDRHAVLTFDWKNKVVTNDVQNKPWSMALPAATLDKLSYQLQLSADLLNGAKTLQYQIADGGNLKEYGFELQSSEQINTPIGKVEAIKIKRIRDSDSKRVTYLWVAPAWSYMLVRLRQQEGDGEYFEINLANAHINGQPLQGK